MRPNRSLKGDRMKRQQVHDALDAAFADGVKLLFGVLVQGVISGDTEGAQGRFEKGISFHDDAYARASAAIDKIFPE